MSPARAVLIWVALAAAIVVPLGAAAASPLLGWREPIYILGGFAGIVGLSLMLLQPLLIGGYLPGSSAQGGRRLHRVVGGLLVGAVVIHVVALWITSPPDVVDALLFTSPTPFSAWGVIAMWALFASAFLVAFRQRLRLRPLAWRTGHTALAVLIVLGTVVHALLIEGTMETVSKWILCALVSAVTLIVVAQRKVWAKRSHSR